jgi:hypothetical protein
MSTILLALGYSLVSWREQVPTAAKKKLLEPISKLSEEDNEVGELDKAEEVLGVEFPADEYAALPLYPGEETLDEPPSHIAAQLSSILRRRLDAIGAVWRDHLNTISS